MKTDHDEIPNAKVISKFLLQRKRWSFSAYFSKKDHISVFRFDLNFLANTIQKYDMQNRFTLYISIPF